MSDVTIEKVSLTEITRDERVNTRPVQPSWVNMKLAEGFSEEEFGVPSLSRRRSGRLVVLDGQNRCELARQAIDPNAVVECRILHGLSVPEEADLFLGLNGGRRVQPVYHFLAEVTAQHEQAVAIDSIVRAVGWKINDQAGTHFIVAVRGLERAYRLTPDDLGWALHQGLYTLTRAFGHTSDTVVGELIHGMSIVYARHGNEVDVNRMISKLSTLPSGARGLLGEARGVRTQMNMTVAQGVAFAASREYNKGRRNKLSLI